MTIPVSLSTENLSLSSPSLSYETSEFSPGPSISLASTRVELPPENYILHVNQVKVYSEKCELLLE